MTHQERDVRWLLIAASLVAAAAAHPLAADRPAIDNARVRVYRTTAGALGSIEHGPGVIVSVEAGDLGKAVWVDDAAAPDTQMPLRGAIVVVQPRARRPPSPPAGSKPGEAPFTGMSFTPLFDNDRVSVLRARMEVGAREGVHTHASDTIVVHLSGGEIEDTADGKTVVNRWKRGDAEFEAFGSSHSARNVGGAVDVVLVALKP
jgi:quercetin dioxygenase-like cupin family protein